MQKRLKDYFIPHEDNDFAPHSLQKAAVVGMSVLVVLSFAIANLQSILWVSSDWLVSTVLPAVIVELTNEERDDAVVPQLRRNSVLDVAATLKAQHMAQNKYFSHYSPDGVSPWYWFDTANYNFVHAGENLAIHFTDSSDVVEAWMESPAHRANIMNGNYTEIGVGTAEGTFEGYNTIYVVQLFGTPSAPATPAPSLTPPPAPTPVVASETTDAPDEVLAEAVEITETVEVVPAEPVFLASAEPEIVPEETASEAAPVMETVPEETAVVDMDITEAGVALYSDHLATTTGGIPASVESSPTETGPPGEVNFFTQLATQPHVVLQMLYVLIAVVVVASLLVSIVIEINHQQPMQVAYSLALLLFMFGLYQLHVFINDTVVII